MPPTSATVPCVASCTLVMVSGLPSTLVSLANSVAALSVSGVSSLVTALSATATAGSCTGFTVRFTVAVLVPPLPSETV